MKAAPGAQADLLELQAIDTTISQLEHRRRSLPELAQIAEGAKQRSALSDDLVAARTVVGDLEAELTKAESDLVPVKERKVRNQKRLDDGQVSDPKQLSALMDEVEHLTGRISDLEDIQLEAMERLEEATAEKERIIAARTELENSLRALIASRDEQFAQLDTELAAQRARRDAAIALLPADLVALYQRIAARSGGVGAARLNGKRCGGCQLEATQSALAAYAAAAPDEVVRCEECERILVRSAE